MFQKIIVFDSLLVLMAITFTANLAAQQGPETESMVFIRDYLGSDVNLSRKSKGNFNSAHSLIVYLESMDYDVGFNFTSALKKMKAIIAVKSYELGIIFKCLGEVRKRDSKDEIFTRRHVIEALLTFGLKAFIERKTKQFVELRQMTELSCNELASSKLHTDKLAYEKAVLKLKKNIAKMRALKMEAGELLPLLNLRTAHYLDVLP